MSQPQAVNVASVKLWGPNGYRVSFSNREIMTGSRESETEPHRRVMRLAVSVAQGASWLSREQGRMFVQCVGDAWNAERDMGRALSFAARPPGIRSVSASRDADAVFTVNVRYTHGLELERFFIDGGKIYQEDGHTDSVGAMFAWAALDCSEVQIENLRQTWNQNHSIPGLQAAIDRMCDVRVVIVHADLITFDHRTEDIAAVDPTNPTANGFKTWVIWAMNEMKEAEPARRQRVASEMLRAWNGIRNRSDMETIARREVEAWNNGEIASVHSSVALLSAVSTAGRKFEIDIAEPCREPSDTMPPVAGAVGWIAWCLSRIDGDPAQGSDGLMRLWNTTKDLAGLEAAAKLVVSLHGAPENPAKPVVTGSATIEIDSIEYSADGIKIRIGHNNEIGIETGRPLNKPDEDDDSSKFGNACDWIAWCASRITQWHHRHNETLRILWNTTQDNAAVRREAIRIVANHITDTRVTHGPDAQWSVDFHAPHMASPDAISARTQIRWIVLAMNGADRQAREDCAKELVSLWNYSYDLGPLAGPTIRPTQKKENGMLKNVKEGAIRAAGSQFVKLSRANLVGLLSRNLAPGDDSARGKIAAFLETEVGTAMLSAVLSAGLTTLPAGTMKGLPEEFARELRVKAMADAGDVLADVVMEPMRETVAMYLQGDEAARGLPAPTEKTQAFVAADEKVAVL